MKNENSTIEEQLTPKGMFHSSAALKDKIMKEAQKENPIFTRNSSKIKKIVWTAVSAVAALAVIVVARPFVKQAYSMETNFIKASACFTEASTYVAEIDARTTPKENFAYVDATENFVRHKITVQPTTGRWRLEKPGRVAMYDGKCTWLWHPQENYGYQWNTNAQGVIEDFAILADPFMMMELEKLYVRNNPKAVCKKTIENGLVTLVIEAPANGDYENDYCRNTSLEDMDTYREYVFEKKTGRLLRLKIDAEIKGKTITVFEMKNIQYNVELDESIFKTPTDINWKMLEEDFDVKDAVVKSFVGISPERAVEMAFAAMKDWDTTVLNVVMFQYSVNELKETYEGCQLIGHKKAFHSGRYAGVFVPCKIRYRDNTVVKKNIAIRNDNKQSVWLVDGGI